MAYKSKPNIYTGPTKAGIYKSDKPGFLKVIAPYSKPFVEDLKSWIQPSHRMWNPEAKYWEVQEMHLEILTTLLEKHYDEVETSLKSEEKVPDNLFTPVFEALNQLPNDQMNKIYKALSSACHPDVGGSNALMSKLNQAFQGVTKEK